MASGIIFSAQYGHLTRLDSSEASDIFQPDPAFLNNLQASPRSVLPAEQNHNTTVRVIYKKERKFPVLFSKSERAGITRPPILWFLPLLRALLVGQLRSRSPKILNTCPSLATLRSLPGNSRGNSCASSSTTSFSSFSTRSAGTRSRVASLTLNT